MSARARTGPTRRWTPERWCQAQYGALGLVLFAALLLLLMRTMALLSQ